MSEKVSNLSKLITEVVNQTRLAHGLLDNLKRTILAEEFQRGAA